MRELRSTHKAVSDPYVSRRRTRSRGKDLSLLRRTTSKLHSSDDESAVSLDFQGTTGASTSTGPPELVLVEELEPYRSKWSLLAKTEPEMIGALSTVCKRFMDYQKTVDQVFSTLQNLSVVGSPVISRPITSGKPDVNPVSTGPTITVPPKVNVDAETSPSVGDTIDCTPGSDLDLDRSVTRSVPDVLEAFSSKLPRVELKRLNLPVSPKVTKPIFSAWDPPTVPTKTVKTGVKPKIKEDKLVNIPQYSKSGSSRQLGKAPRSGATRRSTKTGSSRPSSRKEKSKPVCKSSDRERSGSTSDSLTIDLPDQTEIKNLTKSGTKELAVNQPPLGRSSPVETTVESASVDQTSSGSPDVITSQVVRSPTKSPQLTYAGVVKSPLGSPKKNQRNLEVTPPVSPSRLTQEDDEDKRWRIPIVRSTIVVTPVKQRSPGRPESNVPPKTADTSIKSTVVVTPTKQPPVENAVVVETTSKPLPVVKPVAEALPNQPLPANPALIETVKMEQQTIPPVAVKSPTKPPRLDQPAVGSTPPDQQLDVPVAASFSPTIRHLLVPPAPFKPCRDMVQQLDFGLVPKKQPILQPTLDQPSTQRLPLDKPGGNPVSALVPYGGKPPVVPQKAAVDQQKPKRKRKNNYHCRSCGSHRHHTHQCDGKPRKPQGEGTSEPIVLPPVPEPELPPALAQWRALQTKRTQEKQETVTSGAYDVTKPRNSGSISSSGVSSRRESISTDMETSLSSHLSTSRDSQIDQSPTCGPVDWYQPHPGHDQRESYRRPPPNASGDGRFAYPYHEQHASRYVMPGFAVETRYEKRITPTGNPGWNYQRAQSSSNWRGTEQPGPHEPGSTLPNTYQQYPPGSGGVRGFDEPL